MVYLDVQGQDGGCGNIRVSFQSTNDANPGGTAGPTYDHDSIDDLATQTAASSGQELVWNVPLEVATNTAELKPNPDRSCVGTISPCLVSMFRSDQFTDLPWA